VVSLKIYTMNKTMSRELGNPIALGRTSEIYSWDQEHVLKLFYYWVGLESVENEARISHAIYESGLPVPEVGKIIHVNERAGLIYQRIYGDSIHKVTQRKPWKIPHYSKRIAELHVQIHSHSISTDLPSQRQMLERSIQQATVLSDHLRSKVLAALKAMPDGNQLCHGDFWPGNILITPHREVIIDWNRASYGNPLADVARTINATLGFIKTKQVNRSFLSYGESKTSQVKNSLFRMVVSISYRVYLRRYFQLCPGGEDEYHRWLPIVAAARLADNIPEFEEMLIEQVESNL
jgi:uncharacterized protein (TIGR02172 family)